MGFLSRTGKRRASSGTRRTGSGPGLERTTRNPEQAVAQSAVRESVRKHKLALGLKGREVCISQSYQREESFVDCGIESLEPSLRDVQRDDQGPAHRNFPGKTTSSHSGQDTDRMGWSGCPSQQTRSEFHHWLSRSHQNSAASRLRSSIESCRMHLGSPQAA